MGYRRTLAAHRCLAWNLDVTLRIQERCVLGIRSV